MKPREASEDEVLLDEIAMERRAYREQQTREQQTREQQTRERKRVIRVPTDPSGKQVMKDIHIKGEKDVAYVQESKSIVSDSGDNVVEEKCPAAPKGIAVKREEHRCFIEQASSGVACPKDYVVWTRDKQCYPPCPKGSKRSDNNLCIPTTVKRMCQIGKSVVANSCPPNNVLIRNRCYPKCPDGLIHDMNACMCISAKRKRIEGGPSPMQCPENYEFVDQKCFPKCPKPFSRVENSGICEYAFSKNN
jgi:hypothetical protein